MRLEPLRLLVVVVGEVRTDVAAHVLVDLHLHPVGRRLVTVRVHPVLEGLDALDHERDLGQLAVDGRPNSDFVVGDEIDNALAVASDEAIADDVELLGRSGVIDHCEKLRLEIVGLAVEVELVERNAVNVRAVFRRTSRS